MTAAVLHIDASARYDDSLSRALSARLAVGLAQANGAPRLERDLGQGLELLDAAWLSANVTPADERNAAQRARLAVSDRLIEELERADTLVIGCPIYNFAPPAAFKAWIDQVCRAGRTFRYTENGPEGLLQGKRAFVIVTSGGTAVDSPIDFATPYLRHVLGFIGIHEVEVVAADRIMARRDEAIANANARIDKLLANEDR